MKAAVLSLSLVLLLNSCETVKQIGFGVFYTPQEKKLDLQFQFPKSGYVRATK